MTAPCSKILVVLTSLALAVSFCTLPAYASSGITAAISQTSFNSRQSLSAQKAAEKTAAYSIKKHSASKKFDKIIAKYSYAEPVLKGSSKVAKKINKHSHALYKKSLVTKKTVMTYANNDRSLGNPYTSVYHATTKAKVTYNKMGYFSVRYSSSTFVGGSRDTSATTGATYSLATGKKLNVSNVISGDAATVKGKIADALMKKYNYSRAYSELGKINISDIHFYLKGGKVVVHFNAFEIGLGYGSMTVTLPGSYA